MRQRNGNILIVLLALLLLVTISAIGYFYWSTSIKISTDKQNQKNPPVINETANWKTYTSIKYGYSIKYPQEWSLKIENFDYSHEERVSLDYNLPSNNNDFVAITISTTTGSYSTTGIGKPNSIINGVNVYKVSLPSGQNPAQEGTAFNRNNNYYSIWMFYGDKKYVDIYNKILSTFTFANWRTYTDKVIGISFEYPNGWNVSSQAPGSDYYIWMGNFVSKSPTATLEPGQTFFLINEGIRDPNAHSVKLTGITTLEKLKGVLSHDNTSTLTDQKSLQIDGYYALSGMIANEKITYILDGKGKVVIISTDVSNGRSTEYEGLVNSLKFLN